MPSDGLTPEQHRAADLLGRNWTHADVAFEVGKSEKSIQRWMKLPDFAAAVKERRDVLLSQIPNAKATLDAALNATKSDGTPDWTVRVKAAQLLLSSVNPVAPDPEDERPPTFIYLPEDGDGGDES